MKNSRKNNFTYAAKYSTIIFEKLYNLFIFVYTVVIQPVIARVGIRGRFMNKKEFYGFNKIHSRVGQPRRAEKA